MTISNGAIGTTPAVLKNIHQAEVNIAIYNRDTQAFKSQINGLLKQDIQVKSRGDIDSILQELSNTIAPEKFGLILEDIKGLLHHFKDVTAAQDFRLQLATVNTNMCRKFHTDVNDLRMLCTYSGPGTLWLTDENINQEALNTPRSEAPVFKDESKIQQAKTGSVLILKGAIYPKKGTNAVVHRSPTIEESGEKRLLLRIDTNQFTIFQ